MKYSIEEIRDITAKNNEVALKRFETWKKKRIDKENKEALNIIKKVNKQICKSAKKGLSQAFVDAGHIIDTQEEIIRDYFELRMYSINFNKYAFNEETMIIVSWEKGENK